MICNSADSEMTSAIQTCEANQVYLTQFFRIISEENSPEVYQTACNSPYYLGAVHEDEVTNGYTLVNLLLENGDRNIGLEAWTVGDATFQQRWTGYKKAVDEWNEANPDDQATMTEPVYANTSSEEGAAAALSLYNSNPDAETDKKWTIATDTVFKPFEYTDDSGNFVGCLEDQRSVWSFPDL